jgi:hypothetical protein
MEELSIADQADLMAAIWFKGSKNRAMSAIMIVNPWGVVHTSCKLLVESSNTCYENSVQIFNSRGNNWWSS